MGTTVLVLLAATVVVPAALGQQEQPTEFTRRLSAIGQQWVATAATAASAFRSCAADRDRLACPAGGSSSPVDFTQPVPPSQNVVLTAAANEPTVAGADAQDVLCGAQALQPTWQEALADARREAGGDGANPDLRHQYFADVATRGAAVYPAPPWDCAHGYDVRERPWYKAGISAAKDVVVVVDFGASDVANVTTAERLASATVAAEAVLQSLSFRDHFAVVPFADAANVTVSPTLLPATPANVNRAKQWLVEANSTWTRARRPSLTAAMRGAAAVLAASAAASVGSRCLQLIVAVTPGYDFTPRSDPFAQLTASALGVPVVVLAQTANASTFDEPGPLRRLACLSDGAVVPLQRGDEQQAADRVAMFAASLAPPALRWSEVYEDWFGQGRVATAVWPTEANATTGTVGGLLAADVPLAALAAGDALTEPNVTALLRAAHSCGVTRGASERGFGCRAAPFNDGTGGAEPTVRRLRPLWIVISVVIPLVIALAPVPFEPQKRLAVVVFLVLAVSALSFFWTFGDAYISRDALVAVQFEVISVTASPYPCCATHNCSCSEVAAAGAPSCAALAAAFTEGVCGNGGRCCAYRSYQCGDSKNPRTCWRCTRSVLNDRCAVACGTCHLVTVGIEYKFQERRLADSIEATCPLHNGTECVHARRRAYPVGSSHLGHLDPETLELRLSLPEEPTIQMVFVGVLIAPALIGRLACAVGNCVNYDGPAADDQADRAGDAPPRGGRRCGRVRTKCKEHTCPCGG